MIRKFAVAFVASVVVLSIAANSAWSQRKRPPVAQIQLLEPTAETLVGTVPVRVKVTPVQSAQKITTVFAGLGGAPWITLQPTDAVNVWGGKLDTTLYPNGTQVLKIGTNDKRARKEVPFPVANPLKVYFADLHSHTAYSDGTLLPTDAHKYARDVAKLDVFCNTDHLESIDDNEWLDSRDVAFKSNENGSFVSFPGLEWTKKWGHLNIFDPKTRHWPNDPAEFYKVAAAAGVVTKFNHPGDGSTKHDGLKYSEIGDKTVQLMEVRQVTEEKAFIRALNNGWHIAPEGSDDTHSPNWGNCGRWTGILAPGLSKRNILDALAKRHCYSALDRNCELTFQVNGATMGDIIEEPINKVKVRVVVKDADTDDKTAKIELFGDGVVVATMEAGTSECWWEPAVNAAPGKHYYFTQIGADHIRRSFSRRC